MNKEEKTNKDPSERLEQLAGFDAAKGLPLSDVLFKEVLEEVTANRREEAKEKARGLLKQALEIRETMVKAKRDFHGNQQKFNNTLGKLLNRLESQLRGQPEPKDNEETEEEK